MTGSFAHIEDVTCYEGSFLRVAQARFSAPDGSEHRRDVVRHPGAVGIVALDGDDVFLVRQYRAPVDKEVIEIVAGKIDQGDADPACTAHREVVEELGMVAGSLRHLQSIVMTPGFCDERLELFVASDLSQANRAPHGIEEDHMETLRMPMTAALSMVQSGEIDDAKTVIGLWAVAGARYSG
ncbi:MAG: NUDIX hydrolase [Acidobacteria bacterium]|nr:NUDIX hydrolase [Acidobacteriota bacterium]